MMMMMMMIMTLPQYREIWYRGIPWVPWVPPISRSLPAPLRADLTSHSLGDTIFSNIVVYRWKVRSACLCCCFDHRCVVFTVVCTLPFTAKGTYAVFHGLRMNMNCRYNSSMSYVVAFLWILAWLQCCQCSTTGKGKQSWTWTWNVNIDL